MRSILICNEGSIGASLLALTFSFSKAMFVISGDQSRHAIVAGAILLAHAVAIYGLLLLGPRFATSLASAPVEVRFIAEAPQQPHWEPPVVTAVRPDIVTPMPDVPVVESPVLPASDRAISLPAQPPVARTPAPQSGAPRLISSVEYLREPSPRYPPQSRKLREQGLVVLRVLIDERGTACSIEVETSSGHERLDHAAREAVSRAAFRPYIEDGEPRRAFVLIPIEFSLNRGAA